MRNLLRGSVMGGVFLMTGMLVVAKAADGPAGAELTPREVTPDAAAAGVIDRAVFWEKLSALVDKNETFEFLNKKGQSRTVRIAKNVLTGQRRETIEAIFDYWEKTGGGHPKHLALMLGTAYRESCGLLSTGIGEACGCKAICTKDELPTASYGRKNNQGLAYFGRGLVQLTHERNYERIGKLMTERPPLREQPDLAYRKDYAIEMLVEGVRKHWYAGKPIENYLDDEKADWVQARNSVNPGSPNKVATGYLACRFYDALQPAYRVSHPTQDASLCTSLKNV